MPGLGALLLALIAACLVPAAAAQANFVGTGSDPAGDSADPNPARDIIAATLSYERSTGELEGSIQMRATPGDDARTHLTLFAGVRTAAGCNGIPAAGFHWFTDEHFPIWKRIDDPTGAGPSDNASKLPYDDGVTEFEATDDQLAGHRFDCVYAAASEPGNPANVYDTAEFDLVGRPALSVTVRGLGRSFKPNRPRKLRITLSNPGDGATSPVRVRLGRARGLRARPAKKSVGAIAPGARKKLTLKVTLSGRARDLTEVNLTARAGKMVARGELRLVLDRPSEPGSGNGGTDRPTRTCTRWMPDPFGGTGGSLILVAC